MIGAGCQSSRIGIVLKDVISSRMLSNSTKHKNRQSEQVLLDSSTEPFGKMLVLPILIFSSYNNRIPRKGLLAAFFLLSDSNRNGEIPLLAKLMFSLNKFAILLCFSKFLN